MFRQRQAGIIKHRVAGCATGFVDVSVNFQHVRAACFGMQRVYILRNQQEFRVMAFHRRNRVMRGIRLGVAVFLFAINVPFPHTFRIALKSLRRGEIFKIKAAPRAIRPAKRRDAAFGGDARAGNHRDGRGVAQFSNGIGKMFSQHSQVFLEERSRSI